MNTLNINSINYKLISDCGKVDDDVYLNVIKLITFIRQSPEIGIYGTAVTPITEKPKTIRERSIW
jgi:hypothetical protein